MTHTGVGTWVPTEAPRRKPVLKCSLGTAFLYTHRQIVLRNDEDDVRPFAIGLVPLLCAERKESPYHGSPVSKIWAVSHLAKSYKCGHQVTSILWEFTSCSRASLHF